MPLFISTRFLPQNLFYVATLELEFLFHFPSWIPSPLFCYICHWNNLKVKILCSIFLVLYIYHWWLSSAPWVTIYITLTYPHNYFLRNILIDAKIAIIEAAVCYVVSNDTWQFSSLIRNRMHVWFISSSYAKQVTSQLLVFEISLIKPKFSTTKCEWQNGRHTRFWENFLLPCVFMYKINVPIHDI